jgi:hypothetical protein
MHQKFCSPNTNSFLHIPRECTAKLQKQTQTRFTLAMDYTVLGTNAKRVIYVCVVTVESLINHKPTNFSRNSCQLIMTTNYDRLQMTTTNRLVDSTHVYTSAVHFSLRNTKSEVFSPSYRVQNHFPEVPTGNTSYSNDLCVVSITLL